MHIFFFPLWLLYGFFSYSMYVLPGTKEDNGKVTEAVSIYSNNIYHMWTARFWDIDDEKQCKTSFQRMSTTVWWGSCALTSASCAWSQIPSSCSGQQLQLCSSNNPSQRTNPGGKNASSVHSLLGHREATEPCCQEVKEGTTKFTRSTEIHQFKLLRKVHPDGLIQIMLKPVQALHIISCLGGFQGWLTTKHVTYTAVLQTPG